MKRVFLVLFVLQLLICPSLFAQIAKIIDTKGDVSVKKESSFPWEKAKPDMYLADKAEIRTGSDSECTLSFDEELDNILTIKGDSHIKIEDIKKGRVFLPKGRVFTLIEDLAKLQDFQIRTPTAVAGVRGTGEEVKVNGDTTVKCFEGKAYAQGIDKSGKKTNKKNIPKGFGIVAFLGGALGDLFGLRDQDWFDWQEFRELVRELRWPGSGRGRKEPLKELEDEGKEDHKEDDFEREYYRKGGGGSSFTIESFSTSP